MTEVNYILFLNLLAHKESIPESKLYLLFRMFLFLELS